VIYDDVTNSRDFTYVDNVIQMNNLAACWERSNLPTAIIFNTAVGERNDLNMLTRYLKQYLSEFDSDIADVEIKYGSNRLGDIPHSLAGIEKAKTLLGYSPSHNLQQGLKKAVKWYCENLLK